MSGPLDGILVLDFSTLLPGPLATLLLAEAGAEVIKIERPAPGSSRAQPDSPPGKGSSRAEPDSPPEEGSSRAQPDSPRGTGGDEMRRYTPRFGRDAVNFALLNRGKRSLAVDLKDEAGQARLRPLIERADVLVEQFRPGVMARLGLGYEQLSVVNPRLVYCSITGYGQTGPKAQVAAHDLNYIAETGLLCLSAGADGAPVLPPALIADIAGGSYPAVMNILLALRERDRTGRGRHLDIAMCDNLFPLMYWALGQALLEQGWPRPGGELVTGGSPRYRIYRTADGRFLAAAPLEQKFWQRFTALIGLGPPMSDDAVDPATTIAAVAAIIERHDAAHWRARFEGEDVCCSIVQSFEDALSDPHFRSRGLFIGEVVEPGGGAIPALPVPLAPPFRRGGRVVYPALGEMEQP